MLKLEQIVKDYTAGSTTVRALKGIDLQFRESEFVAVLGHSGCGKTTLLNIIGGLDQYTGGDLVINGKSTRDFSDGDWDSYRNHSVGFVFQNYNLIPHQTVLSNVELALTLSGVSKAERRARAKKVLEEVGLGDQLYKKPNQMSGGQMQRVAIARALVNDPDILLADEPTGALDTETSVQVMEILKKISSDRLIIMVTHNPELADAYASRIVRLRDGEIVGDTNPCGAVEEAEAEEGKKAKKPSMSFFTALSLSLNNLMTKKTRTFLTAFAGSIGIIGIALILSLSNGIQSYIDRVQEETLSSYPITIEAETLDMGAMMLTMMGSNHQNGENAQREENRVYSSTVMYNMMDSMMNMETSTNNLKAFKEFLDAGGGGIADISTVRYSYDVPFDVYTRDEEGAVVKSDIAALMEDAFAAMTGGGTNPMLSNGSMGAMTATMNVWEELLLGENGGLISESVKEQYDIIHGRWPENYDEVVLFVDKNNEISDLMLVSLGLVPSSKLDATMEALASGEGEVESVSESWSYEELCALEFKLILPAETYRLDPLSGAYTDIAATEAGMELLYKSEDVGTPLKIVGIARPGEDASSAMVTGAIGYTSALTKYAIETTLSQGVVADQLADPATDVFCGLPFATGEEEEPGSDEKAEAAKGVISAFGAAEKAAVYIALMSRPDDAYVETVVAGQMEQLDRAAIETMVTEQYAAQMGVDAETIMGYIGQMSDEELFAYVEEAMTEQVSAQYAAAVEQQMAALPTEQLAAMMDALLSGDEAALAYMGLSPLDSSQYDFLYDNYMPPTLSEGSYEENLETLGYVQLSDPSAINIYAASFADKDLIAEAINAYNEGVSEADRIEYTDYVALLMSSITTIINAISYVLIAFVAISLVVSSIMIGIITYISVLERTKEIGILRSIGASKRDVSRVFNAETLIVGFVSGAIGIGATLLLTIPINALVHHLTDIQSLNASLPPAAGAILVVISMVLTFVAGLVPSGIAARKDPVEALRTE